MAVTRVTYRIGNEDLILETGRLAKQANGAVYVQYAGSAVIATACASASCQEGLDYVPLTVDYNEKYYAAGKIPGGFIKREGRPKDKEILVSRLIDRPMRPLFEKSFGRDIQVIPTCVSSDMTNPPDILAVIASSAAVHISDIPFHGPVAAARVAYLDGQYVINPTFEQIEKSEMEIVVAGTAEGFTMVEGGAKEVSEEIMLGALEKAQEFITVMCKLQDDLRARAGKEKLPLAPLTVTLQNEQEILQAALPRMEEACFVKGKHLRHEAIEAVKSDLQARYAEQLQDEVQLKLFHALFDEMEYNILRKSILSLWQWPRSEPCWTSRCMTISTGTAGSILSCIIIFRLIRSARLAAWEPDAGKSGTEILPAVRWSRWCRTGRNFRIPSAWCRRFWNPMVLRPWRLYAAEPCVCSPPEFR